MEWLFIFGLIIWLGRQTLRIDQLTRKLAKLETRLASMPAEPSPTPPIWVPATVPQEEPLLLDSPLPQASNDDEPFAPAAALRQTPRPEPTRDAPPLSAAKPEPPRARPFESWLAENGLAWLGGAALALGGIYLVSLASERNWITAPVRLGLALLLGAGLIGLSQHLRRSSVRRPPGHPLVAALCAGAGAAAFYATAWAAHGLYNYISWPVAAALLTFCAALLVALSFLHGQALGALAIAAALIAPPLTGLSAWPEAALTLYVCGVSAAGFTLAIARRWAWSAAAALAGLYFWFAAAIAADEVWRALIFVSFASVGGVLLAAREQESAAPPDWERARALGPVIALCMSSVLLLWTWFAIAAAPPERLLGPGLIGMFHVALAAYAVRGRVASAEVFTVAAGALGLGFLGYSYERLYLGPLGGSFYAGALLAGLVIAIAAFAARPHHSARALTAIAGAAGLALLTALAAATRPDWHGAAAWVALSVGAALLFAAADRAARDGADQTRDLATDAWAGAGAIVLLLAVESAFTAPLSVGASALACLALAWGYGQRGWRALRYAAPSAATLALAYALTPVFWDYALAGTMPLLGALALLAASAGLLLWAARLARARGRGVHEALATASVLTLIVGMFLALNAFARGEGAPLDPLTASALRALTLIAAGYILTRGAGAGAGFIARWRGHVLLAAGLGMALFSHGVELNPWWGWAPAAIAGPALLNVLALAYAAPAALALAAARDCASTNHPLTRAYAAIGIAMAFFWASLEIRHLFHGANMNAPGFRGIEGYVHCLWPLALVCARARWAAAQRPTIGAFFANAAWPALAWAGLGLWLAFNPWWGWEPARASVLPSLAACGLAAWLSATAPARAETNLAHAARLASVAHLLVAVTLAVRYLFQGPALAAGLPPMDGELWSYSAAWALFGGGAFWLGARRAEPLLRWCGLGILVATSAYVAFLAFTRLDAMARVGSLLGLAGILLAVAWFARKQASPN